MYNLFTTATQIVGADWPYEQSGIEIANPIENTIKVVPGSTLGSSNKNMTVSETTQA